MVMQERLFFRNIPLSNWIEHEMIVEEGLDLDQLPKESVFATPALASHAPAPPVPQVEDRLTISKFLDEVTTVGRRNGHESKALIATPVAAFGAQ
jgi:hypothetical protein